MKIIYLALILSIILCIGNIYFDDDISFKTSGDFKDADDDGMSDFIFFPRLVTSSGFYYGAIIIFSMNLL